LVYFSRFGILYQEKSGNRGRISFFSDEVGSMYRNGIYHWFYEICNCLAKKMLQYRHVAMFLLTANGNWMHKLKYFWNEILNSNFLGALENFVRDLFPKSLDHNVIAQRNKNFPVSRTDIFIFNLLRSCKQVSVT
jgi:hypothetical protein